MNYVCFTAIVEILHTCKVESSIYIVTALGAGEAGNWSVCPTGPAGHGPGLLDACCLQMGTL